MIMILSLVQNVSYGAKVQDSLGVKLSYKRYTSEEGWGYALNNGTAHPIYQILKVNGSNIAGTNYFCLDPETSYSWNYHTQTDTNGNTYHVAGNISDTANYTDYYDMEKTNLSAEKIQVITSPQVPITYPFIIQLKTLSTPISLLM